MSGSYLATRLQLEDELRRDERLTPLAFKVAIELVRRRHVDTGRCNISIPKMAEALHCGTRTVDRALAALVAAGWIIRTSGKGRSSNSYVIPQLDGLAPQIDRTPAQQDAPGANYDLSTRQNGATTHASSRQNGATKDTLPRQDGATGDLLSRHFDNVVAPFSTSLSRQNGAQSLLRNSLKDLTPKAPDVETDPVKASGGCRDLPQRGSKPKAGTGLGFDRFWKAWPNHVGKPAALKAFAKHVDKIDEILAGVERYIRDKPADRPWLNPATFLNQERWNDRPASTNGARRPVVPDLPDDPMIEFPGGIKRRTSSVRRALNAFAARPRDWPPEMGAPPGTPGCRVPKHLLVEENAGA